ncbi:MAG: hypothetical protein LWX83_18150 [Anaerolineae bacterium]|nr:hypothetical protein [Anaerolineae bacterium]
MKSIYAQFGLLFVSVLIIGFVVQGTNTLNQSLSKQTENSAVSSSTATFMPQGTQYPTPTETSIPATNTPAPTITPTIQSTLPDQLLSHFSNPQIDFYDQFSSANDTNWDNINDASVSNGTLDYTVIPDGSNITRNRIFTEGTGLLLDFKYNSELAYFSMGIKTGTAGTPDYRAFGIERSGQSGYQSNEIVNGNIWLGSTPQITVANVWYRMAIGVGKDGNLMMLLWQRDKPTSLPHVIQTRQMKNDFSGLNWTFHFGGEGTTQEPTISLENYYEFTFDELR